jgi:hypothetical protein
MLQRRFLTCLLIISYVSILQICEGRRFPLVFPSFFLSSNPPSSYNSYSTHFFSQPLPLKDRFREKYFMRQVPGDGGCLFHTISTWLNFIKYGKHLEFDEKQHFLSLKLRSLAVSLIRNDSLIFYEEDNRRLTSIELRKMISESMNITAEEYCEKMLLATEWGGGPEIIALANHFQCPIYIYQLNTYWKMDNTAKKEEKPSEKNQSRFRKWLNSKKKKEFCVELIAKFGSPIYEYHLPICILHVDGR